MAKNESATANNATLDTFMFATVATVATVATDVKGCDSHPDHAATRTDFRSGRSVSAMASANG